MILIVDNYDSFTYNLVQRLGEMDASLDIQVHRNDKISVEEIKDLAPSHIIISPGPCTPNEAGISVKCVEAFHGKLPMLGVCLGHQSIGQATGGTIVRAEKLMHGKTDKIHHNGKAIFAGLPNPMIATRYHSLVIKADTLSDAKVIRLHGHCHQKATASLAPSVRMLQLPSNYRVRLIPSGCCGMAGSFGFEEEHYDLSMQIGELVLFPTVRNEPVENLIAASGTSCRHQILDGTGRVALHPIEILRDAIG